MSTKQEPKRSRLIAGHTQRQAAETLGVHLRTWESWERGIHEMPSYALTLYRHLAGVERIPFTSHEYRRAS
jgi:DNA-binding XRE family transcriptional regulator